MDKNYVLFSMVGAIVVIASIISIIITTNNLSPPNDALEKCNELKFNSADAVNILFFSTKEQAKEYSDFFLQVQPFDENKEAFNFYYIDSYTPDCELYKGIALVCYSKKIIKKASSCPSDYIIVIKEKSAEIRSSAYMEVMSINSNHPKSVLIHEFGHAFANFADEYTPATIPKNSKNCVSSCSKFAWETNGCFEGCSKEVYYRSIDEGVMRTLSSKEYGKFNNNLILEKMPKNFQGITSKAIAEFAECNDAAYYLIEGIYNPGNLTLPEKITLLNTSIEKGCAGNGGSGEFEYNFINPDENYSGIEFNPGLIFTDSLKGVSLGGEINGTVFFSELPFILRIPVSKNQGEIIAITKNGATMAEIDLSHAGAMPCKI